MMTRKLILIFGSCLILFLGVPLWAQMGEEEHAEGHDESAQAADPEAPLPGQPQTQDGR